MFVNKGGQGRVILFVEIKCYNVTDRHFLLVVGEVLL